MNRLHILLITIGLISLSTASLRAQSREIGARSLQLDDGSGHIVDITIPAMNPGGPYSWVIPIDANGSFNYLPLTGGEITGTVGIGVAQQTNWALTITEPPGHGGGSWAGGIVINNTDDVGGSLPIVMITRAA